MARKKLNPLQEIELDSMITTINNLVDIYSGEKTYAELLEEAAEIFDTVDPSEDQLKAVYLYGNEASLLVDKLS